MPSRIAPDRAADSPGVKHEALSLSRSDRFDRKFIAALGIVLLGACGGGGGEGPRPSVISAEILSSSARETAEASETTETPETTIEPAMDPCASPAVFDSGHVVYIVAERGCEGVDGSRLLLRWGTQDEQTVFEVELSSFDSAMEVVFAGGHRRVVSVHQRGTWRSFPNVDTWQHRDGAGLLVLRGELYLLGGWLWGPGSSEVWKTRDLMTWSYLGNAPWIHRHGAAWLVHDDKLWVIGGDFIDDVWSSPDGVAWKLERRDAPFGQRYTPNAASINGEIVVYAGQSWNGVTWCTGLDDCAANAPRDVWASRDGKDWRRILPEAPWLGRGLIHGSVVHNGEVFLIGGGLKAADTLAEYRDIWSSSNGKDWTLRRSAYSFSGRTHFSVVATKQGCYVSDGSVGTQRAVTNDLYFAPDCVNFSPVTDAPPLQARHASSFAAYNGSLVILGGPPAGGAGTMIWQYFP